MRRLATIAWFTFMFLLGWKTMERLKGRSENPLWIPAAWSMCERRYFDPTCVPYEGPVLFMIREPADVKRAFAHPGPVLIFFDFWPVCYDDGSIAEGNMRGFCTDCV